MIPKIIHYCWLSEDPIPENIKNYVNSWRKILPDYQFILWNFEKFNINYSTWVKQAYEVKKYAFAADYIRLYALYHYGGIYLDIDVEVVKPFDELLHLPYFIGEENVYGNIKDVEISYKKDNYAIEAATIGAEKGCFWVKKCLEYYNNRKFILASGNFDIKPLPGIMSNIFNTNYSINFINDVELFKNNKNEIYIFPIEFFSPKKWDNPSIFFKTEKTYSIHHFAGSWKKENIDETNIRKYISNGLYKIGKYIFKFIKI